MKNQPAEFAQLRERRRGPGLYRRQRLFATSLCSLIVLVTCSYIFWLTTVSAHNASTTPHIASIKSSVQPPASVTPIPTVVARPTISNVACQSTEQSNYHGHAHLTLIIKDEPVAVPANIGIAYDKKCLYWLHTHDQSGIIHIESAKKDTYTLGTFLRIWKEQFANLQYPSELDARYGWKVYVNGRLYRGDFHSLPLFSHTLITMAYRSYNVEPDSSFFWGTLTP